MINQEEKSKKPRQKKPLKNWAVFSGIGLQMGITIFLGNKLGVWLDERYQFNFLEETLTLVAIFASMYLIIRRVNKLNSDS